jgi:hypothetical protein
MIPLRQGPRFVLQQMESSTLRLERVLGPNWTSGEMAEHLDSSPGELENITRVWRGLEKGIKVRSVLAVCGAWYARGLIVESVGTSDARLPRHGATEYSSDSDSPRAPSRG